jgi:hypothetical protein
MPAHVTVQAPAAVNRANPRRSLVVPEMFTMTFLAFSLPESKPASVIDGMTR